MDFHPVKTASLGVVCAVAKGLDDAVNFLFCQWTAGLVQPSVRNGGRCDWRKFSQVCRNRHSAEPSGHHEKDFAAVCMYPLRHLFAGSDKVYGIEGRVGTIGHALLFHFAIRKSDPGNNQSSATLCSFCIIIDPSLVEASLRVRKPQWTHRRHSESIFNFRRTDFDRCEQVLVLHVNLPSSYSSNSICPAFVGALSRIICYVEEDFFYDVPFIVFAQRFYFPSVPPDTHAQIKID